MRPVSIYRRGHSLSYLPFCRSEPRCGIGRTVGHVDQRLLKAIFPIYKRTGVVLVVLTSIIASSPYVLAQQTEASTGVVNTCDIQISPIDSRQLAADPERTKARIIAQMLQDMDRCIGLQQTRIASSHQVSTPGTQSGARTSQITPPLNPSRQSINTNQSQSLANQTSVENSSPNTNPDDTPKEDPNDTEFSSDIWRTDTRPPTSLQHNTSIFDFGSDDELVLDDYAKTLHEAYLAETDPVLKEALGKELSNYLNNKRK